MAKKESTFFNMTLTLFVITAVAAVALGYVYNITKDPIQKAKDEKLKTAINIVVPGADKGTIEESKLSVDGGELVMYKVIVDGNCIGTAVKTFSNNGFGGLITVMVGFDSEGKIIDSNVLEHKETPGLGDKTSKSVAPWNEQFKGLDISQMKDQMLKVTKDGGVVNAITAATISSRAYCDAIQRGWKAYMDNISKAVAEDKQPDTDETVNETETDVEQIMEETNNE
ncbi:MAG: RnfABCDGE type electron transport complex subunit G [Bacteroidales bacterium]|nr:RnfABCDGE type electron transport complex subunit G [Bacteroidales bacterium]